MPCAFIRAIIKDAGLPEQKGPFHRSGIPGNNNQPDIKICPRFVCTYMHTVHYLLIV
jgi:hypothetical protein